MILNGVIPEKKQEGWRYTFWKPPEVFRFLTLPLEIPDKRKAVPLETYTLQKF